jgi:hypothetical protein
MWTWVWQETEAGWLLTLRPSQYRVPKVHACGVAWLEYSLMTSCGMQREAERISPCQPGHSPQEFRQGITSTTAG